jgi:hypothetical protein
MVRHLVIFAMVSFAALCAVTIAQRPVIAAPLAETPIALVVGNDRYAPDSADRALIIPVMGPQSAVKIKSSQREPDLQPTPTYKPKHCRSHSGWRRSKLRLHCGW